MFDLANPAFAKQEAALLDGLPGLIRLVIWALLGSAVSTGLYRRLLPQARIRRLAERAGRLRKALAAYEDDLAGLLRLAGAMLATSLKHSFTSLVRRSWRRFRCCSFSPGSLPITVIGCRNQARE